MRFFFSTLLCRSEISLSASLFWWKRQVSSLSQAASPLQPVSLLLQIRSKCISSCKTTHSSQTPAPNLLWLDCSSHEGGSVDIGRVLSQDKQLRGWEEKECALHSSPQSLWCLGHSQPHGALPSKRFRDSGLQEMAVKAIAQGSHLLRDEDSLIVTLRIH